VSIALQCHLLAERTCKGKHVFLLHGLCKSFVSIACVGILHKCKEILPVVTDVKDYHSIAFVN